MRGVPERDILSLCVMGWRLEKFGTFSAVAFAAREIMAALNAAEPPASAGWRVVLTADAPPLELGGADWPSVDHPEGYAIRCLPARRVVVAVGGGRSGVTWCDGNVSYVGKIHIDLQLSQQSNSCTAQQMSRLTHGNN